MATTKKPKPKAAKKGATPPAGGTPPKGNLAPPFPKKGKATK